MPVGSVLRDAVAAAPEHGALGRGEARQGDGRTGRKTS